MDRAKALRVAVWLHRLDMSARGGLGDIGRVSASSGVPPGVVSGSCHSRPLVQGGHGTMPV